MPVKLDKDEISLFDRENLLFMGTSVISGSGTALVLRTGDGVVSLLLQPSV